MSKKRVREKSGINDFSFIALGISLRQRIAESSLQTELSVQSFLLSAKKNWTKLT